VRRAGALIAAAVAAAFTFSGTAHAAATQESVFQDDDLLIHVSPAEADRAMAELKDLGVDRVRLSAIWRDLAPAAPPADATDPNAYDQRKLEHLDTAIRTAGAHGIGVLLNVRGGAPAWAIGTPVPHKFAGRDAYRPDPARFRQFAEMLGRRYSGQYAGLPRVDTWSIWNEPNWGGLLQPQSLRDRRTRRLYTVAPTLYRGLYRAATAGLAASGHGADRILLGETAPIGNTKLGELSHLKPVRFLQDLFCLDARLRPLTGRRAKLAQCDFDTAGPLSTTGYAHHPYSVVDAPAEPSADPGFIRLADADRLKRILDAAGRAGRIPRGLPLWYTEYGYQTAPPDPYRGVTLEQQAAWLVAAEHDAWADPRVASSAQFLLRDDEPRTFFGPAEPRYWSTYQTGLKFADGTQKPAYEAYRLPLYAPDGFQPGQPLTLWGMVRPGVNGEAQRVRIEYRGSDAEEWIGLPDQPLTDGHGYFTATVPQARAGQYRFQWIRPEPGDGRPASSSYGPAAASGALGVTG
jgi:hypothetical protein